MLQNKRSPPRLHADLLYELAEKVLFCRNRTSSGGVDLQKSWKKNFMVSYLDIHLRFYDTANLKCANQILE